VKNKFNTDKKRKQHSIGYECSFQLVVFQELSGTANSFIWQQ